jgi:hypothetical protein
MFGFEMYTFDPEMHEGEECVDFMSDQEPIESEVGYTTKFLAVKHALDAMDDYLAENIDQHAECLWCLIVEYAPRPTDREAWTVVNWRDFNEVPPTVSSLD